MKSNQGFPGPQVMATVTRWQGARWSGGTLSNSGTLQLAVPNRQHVEVSSTKIQLLVLCSCQAKTNSKDREN